MSDDATRGPRAPAFDPRALPESNATAYPPPLRDANMMRWNRRLSRHAGLRNFAVNLTRISPGGQSSYRHAHSLHDEFVYVLRGEAVLETDAGEQVLSAGMCAGFPAGAGDAHRFLNRSRADAELLVVGDVFPGDEVSYPDVDMQGRLQEDGSFRVLHKDGTPY